jgi:hypothetical protein
MKTHLEHAAMTSAMLTLFGVTVASIFSAACCTPKSDPAKGPIVIPTDNALGMPACRMIYIGQCPYAWCVRNPYENPAAGLVPMRNGCEPGNTTVSDWRPKESDWKATAE